jgi:hypothetical protein
VGARRQRRNWSAHRIQELAAGDEDDAGARECEQPSAEAGIGLEIMATAFDRAQRDGIDHQPRLQARLDLEEPSDLFQHRHSLMFERADGGFEPRIS